MSLEQVRFNMVEQQIRPWNVLNLDVLDLLFHVKREEYVPEGAAGMAFSDIQIPLGDGAAMLEPKVEARFLQELAIKKTDKILEIGTGIGYLTALLANVGNHVHSVEINPALSAQAEKNLTAHHIHNVTLHVGDGSQGWAANGPYDVIVFSGSLPMLPEALRAQLNEGGRMLVVLGDAPAMSATLVTRENGQFTSARLFETVLPPLTHAEQPNRFVF